MICFVSGGLDFMFQGQSLVSRISFEPVDGSSSNFHRYITEASLRAGLLLVTLTLFSRS